MNKITVLALILVVLGVIGFSRWRSGASETAPSPSPFNEAVVIKGSDTEVQMVSSLVEAFVASNSGTDISVTGGGSGVGIAALINGEVPVANSSREMSGEEIALARERGFEPQSVIVARDMLAVIVHPDNPLAALSLEEIGGIFRGETEDWKDVGGRAGKIQLYGRQSTSGTFVYFQKAVANGEYSPQLRALDGSAGIVEAVASDPNGIGYVGIGYVREGVRALAIVTSEGDISPLDNEAYQSGRYPLSRPLYHYVRQFPSAGSTLGKFLSFEVSDAGQAVVEREGFRRITQDDQQKNGLFFNQFPQ